MTRAEAEAWVGRAVRWYGSGWHADGLVTAVNDDRFEVMFQVWWPKERSTSWTSASCLELLSPKRAEQLRILDARNRLRGRSRAARP